MMVPQSFPHRGKAPRPLLFCDEFACDAHGSSEPVPWACTRPVFLMAMHHEGSWLRHSIVIWPQQTLWRRGMVVWPHVHVDVARLPCGPELVARGDTIQLAR